MPKRETACLNVVFKRGPIYSQGLKSWKMTTLENQIYHFNYMLIPWVTRKQQKVFIESPNKQTRGYKAERGKNNFFWSERLSDVSLCPELECLECNVKLDW